MKLVHNIVVNVFVKYGEDKDKIKSKLVSLFPFDLEEQKIKVEESHATGFGDLPIYILEITVEKDRHVNAFLENLLSKLTAEQKELLLRQKESRLDEENHFFIRLDKPKLMSDEFFVTDSGNCFHIKMSIAAFPASRENALKIVDKIFS